MPTLPPAAPPSLIQGFIDQLWLEEGLSRNTQLSYASDLQLFAGWLAKQQAKAAPQTSVENSLNALLTGVNKVHLLGYLAQVSKTTKSTTQRRIIASIKRFYGYLAKERLLAVDPSLAITLPKMPQRLPKSLTEAQVVALIQSPDINTPAGVRDRAMLEVLYATGLRVSELIRLTVFEVSMEVGAVQLVGKGNKERLVPLGEVALHWIRRYVTEVRPLMLGENAEDGLFLSRLGRRMTRQAFWQLIKRYATIAHLPQESLSPHTLRHAFATHLMNHGADLRVVQMLLGHADIATTEIYTHIAKDHLKTMHQKHHPRG